VGNGIYKQVVESSTLVPSTPTQPGITWYICAESKNANFMDV